MSSLRQRFHGALMSIYLYNEQRGYTQLEALGAALERQRPDEQTLLAAIRAHASDERRHYRMFRAWFVRRGLMPLEVDTETGYIDRLVHAATGATLDTIDFDDAVRGEADLRRLFRLVMLTERRGLSQVRSLLGFGALLLDRDMRAMFEVVERDEPSHFLPYHAWLSARNADTPTLREQLADLYTHLSIVALLMPKLMLDPRVPRCSAFPA